MRKTRAIPARKIAREMQSEPPKPPTKDRELEILREIREMQIDIENLKKTILSTTNIRTLEHDFLREFQHLSKEVKESIEKSRHAVDRMEAEIKFLRGDMKRVMSLEEEMNRLNMKSMTRDIESLKEKSRWLETSFKGFDIDPLVEKISELEDKIKILKASQPLILE